MDNFFPRQASLSETQRRDSSWLILWQVLEWYEQMENGDYQPEQRSHQERRQQLTEKITNAEWQLCNGETDPDSCYTEQPEIS